MVLNILASATSAFPSEYTVHVAISVFVILIIRAFAQGRKTNRERDLHARVVIVTGGFTPLGLVLLQSLAQRGAHIIALSPHSVESDQVSIIISLLRSTTSNENIFAEQCDLTSPASIHAFCVRFLSGEKQRIDAIIFAHEHQHIGSFSWFKQPNPTKDALQRESGSLATFLATTLLLPALLVAPVERDIRIVNVVNPFYAAAAGPSFTAQSASSISPSKQSVFLLEGTRALRTTILTRHLQRILDALPAAQVPKTEESTGAIPVVNSKIQKSNIVAITVSPGISRDTVNILLNANWSDGASSRWGIILYILTQPLLRIFTKSPFAAIQTILHVLFLPTPFKVPPGTKQQPEEVLKPGALYSECAFVDLKLAVPTSVQQEEEEKEKKDAKGKGKAAKEEVAEIQDDGELGGELAGRLVWEAFEAELKAWEEENALKEKVPVAAS